MLPNFFVIGANKAGTTSLYSYLDEHPEVFMSRVKEPSFWALDGKVAEGRRSTRRMVTDRAAYEALFAGATDETAVGEASTVYLPSARAAERIHAEIPHARFIAVLRDPSERAYSAYGMHVANGDEPLTDFAAAIEADLAGDTWRYYVSMGRYAPGLTRWIERFGREQVKVFLYEDLCSDPAGLVRDVYTFLGVDADFSPQLSVRQNVTALPKSRSLSRFVRSSSTAKTLLKRALPASARSGLKQRATEWNRTRPGPMPPEVRARLVGVYAEDIAQTEELIGRDLSAWKAV